MVKNLTLSLASLFLMIALGEWLFPKILGKLPLRLYGSIDKDLRILAQSSKKSQLPHAYIALAGDSYAVGAGDWLEEVRENSFFGSPDYSPAHLIHKKTGIDVVSFGQGGVGSFGGIWAEPVAQFLYINSVKDYRLSPPRYFLVFFYEGNDIYDNIQFITKKLKLTGKEIQKEINLTRLPESLNSEFEKVLNGDFEKSFRKNMLFTRSIFQGISNLMDELVSLNKNQKVYFSYPQSPLNIALMNGEKTPLPVHLQAPPLFGLSLFDKKRQLTEKGLKVGLYVFEQTLAMIAGFFPQTEIKVIFIPSPLSSYQMVSPSVSYRGYMQVNNLVETTVVKQKHIELCEAIQEIASSNNSSFINTTKSLRKASSMEIIHGPIDWDHFNKRGYQVLSADLAGIFLQPGGGTRTDDCVY